MLLRDPAGSVQSRACGSCVPAGTLAQILPLFLQSGQVEVTFQAVRTHLDLQTQPQWCGTAIARTTPALPGLCRWFTRAAYAP